MLYYILNLYCHNHALYFKVYIFWQGFPYYYVQHAKLAQCAHIKVFQGCQTKPKPYPAFCIFVTVNMLKVLIHTEEKLASS